jgi:hypothetical protein
MLQRECFQPRLENVAPRTLQDAWPVCGTENFASVRLQSAPQSHRRLSPFSEQVPWQAGLLAAIKIDPHTHLLMRQTYVHSNDTDVNPVRKRSFSERLLFGGSKSHPDMDTRTFPTQAMFRWLGPGRFR